MVFQLHTNSRLLLSNNFILPTTVRVKRSCCNPTNKRSTTRPVGSYVNTQQLFRKPHLYLFN